jgi:hypothetical protein
MLDAKVVKYDGSVVWASAEPELLWALRGGGGGFCGIQPFQPSILTSIAMFWYTEHKV